MYRGLDCGGYRYSQDGSGGGRGKSLEKHEELLHITVVSYCTSYKYVCLEAYKVFASHVIL